MIIHLQPQSPVQATDQSRQAIVEVSNALANTMKGNKTDAYSQWAIELVEHFFGLKSADQRVRLMITRYFLDQNFAGLGGTSGFLSAMRDGPHWLLNDGKTMHQRGLKLFEMWELPHRRPPIYPKELNVLDDAPPFLPYLCLLCLAWTEGGEELAANAYYDRVTTLYPNHDLRQHLGSWQKLWQGLEKWTAKLKNKRGSFIVEQLGGWVYVGVPRSQVIFTPAKLERLPELFADCGLEAETHISRENLRKVINARELLASQVLGPMVFREIVEESDLGNSALNVIQEQLANWDGETSSPGTDGFGGPNASKETIFLALKPVEDYPKWEVFLVAERDGRLAKITFENGKYKFWNHSETLCTIVDTKSEPVRAGTLFGDWTDGDNIYGKNDEDDLGLAYKFPGKTLRLFDRWDRELLVECKTMPQEGPVYILAHSDAPHQWWAWSAKAQDGKILNEISWPGLPVGQHLFCLPEISKLPEELRSSLPIGMSGASTRSRLLRMTSGTRYNSSTARRVYAEYDPPLLVVQGPADAILSVDGAKADLLGGPQNSTGLLGNTVRTYALTVDAGQAVVIATLEKDGNSIAMVSFGVHRDQGWLENKSSTLFFDPIGNAVTTNGVSGMIVPDIISQWKFTNDRHISGTSFSQSLWSNNAFKFIDSLRLQDGRIAFPEYKRRATHITDIEEWRISEETRTLAQLGYIDLETDLHGRWSYVHPVAGQLVLLPSLANNRYQFILTGTVEINQLKETVQKAIKLLDFEVCVTQPGKFKLVPPRLTFLHNEIDAGHQLAAEMGFLWSPQPPAHALAEWSGTLDVWLKQIVWFPDPGPKPDAEYSPEKFGFVPHHQYAAPWHLRRFVDPFTQQRWHNLFQPENEKHGDRYAFVRDFTWAVWRVHMVLPEDDITNLAYDTRTGRLILPYQLNFPYLLGRALAACSGLPPEMLYQCAPYMKHDAGVLLPEAEPYPGLCYAYQLVPHKIAELIASKVNARLIDVTL